MAQLTAHPDSGHVFQLMIILELTAWSGGKKGAELIDLPEDVSNKIHLPLTQAALCHLPQTGQTLLVSPWAP